MSARMLKNKYNVILWSVDSSSPNKNQIRKAKFCYCEEKPCFNYI